MSTRRRAFLLSLLLLASVVAAVLWRIDAGVRAEETAAVEKCRTESADAIDYLSTRVQTMTTYIRPALTAGIPREVRQNLYLLVSDEAAAAVPPLRRLQERCADVSVQWWHTGLRARRDGCVVELDRRAAHLSTVAGNAEGFFDPVDLPETGCS